MIGITWPAEFGLSMSELLLSERVQIRRRRFQYNGKEELLWAEGKRFHRRQQMRRQTVNGQINGLRE